MATEIEVQWTEQYSGYWETDIVRAASGFVPWQGTVGYCRPLKDYSVDIATWTRNQGRWIGSYASLAEAKLAAVQALSALADDC